jgi:hypothetical protein
MKEKLTADNITEGVGDMQDLRRFIEEVESNPEYRRIDPADFIGVTHSFKGRDEVLFPEGEIKDDISRVDVKMSDIRRKMGDVDGHQKESDMAADFVETMIPQAIRELGWMGDSVRVINPSLYDDLYRGIDMAVQMMPDKVVEDERFVRCMGFSVDFTISHLEAKKKIFDEMVQIAQGKIPSMKYFMAKILTKAGPKEIKLKNFKMPKIIISCTGEVLEEAKEDFLAYEGDKDDLEVKEKASKNPLRYHFIREALAQMRFFIKLAGKVDNPRAREVYSANLVAFESAIKDQEIDEGELEQKLKNIPSLIGKEFDLDANGGQFILILKAFAKQ